jgi:hypothetical protein
MHPPGVRRVRVLAMGLSIARGVSNTVANMAAD